jgi:hypothetical protein
MQLSHWHKRRLQLYYLDEIDITVIHPNNI